jgi:3-isopropylmalate/(R)-2-methylmalate dehydratase large subunit
MITYGTNPGMVIADRRARARRRRRRRAVREGAGLHGLEAGAAAARPAGRRGVHRQLHQRRLSDLREPRRVLRGRGRAAACACWSCPARSRSSARPRPRARPVFRAAGAEWREPGCSMCIAMNGDSVAAGPATRQHQQPQLRGPAGQGRAHLLASPLTAAACAVRRRASPTRATPRLTPPPPQRGGVGAMEPIRVLQSRTVVLPVDNIDTDQIIPARFLTTTDARRAGRALLRRLALRRRRHAARRTSC